MKLIYKLLSMAVLICHSMALLAQNKTISGSIKEGNEPVVGAVVVEKGIDNNVSVTDAQGSFSITLKGSSNTLVIRSVGYISQEINVAAKTSVSVQLKPDVIGLNEVVVVGYGTMLRKDLTGSIASIKGEELAQAGTSSLQDALQGRLSGVQVMTSDATPGGGVQIKIRGGSTLTAGNQPLYVIDGFPITPDYETDINPLSDINPSDVASVEVLKDASATAIYGAEGANGVILITTKQGRKNTKPVVEVSAYTGLSTLTRDIDILNSQQYIDYKLKTLVQTSQYQGAVEGWKLQDPAKGKVWMDQIIQNGRTLNGDIGIRGGSNQGLYYSTNVSYYNEDGILKGSNYERFTARANLDQEVGRKLKFGVKMFYSKVIQDGFMNEYTRESSIFRKALMMSPFSSGKPTTDKDFTAEEEENNYDDNLSALLTDALKLRNIERIQPTFSAQYKILEGLDFNTIYGVDRTTQDYSQFYPASTRSGYSANGKASITTGNNNSWYYNARLNYKFSLKKHRFDALGVFETKGKTKYTYLQDASNFTSDALGVKNLQFAESLSKPEIDEAEETYLSYISRLNYNYDNRYLVTLTYRRDGSSKFGADNKWANFPAVGLAWRIDEEGFMNSKKTTFSNLKVRLGWGITGNSQIGAYSSLARLNTGLYINGDEPVNTLTPTALGNEELKWETTTQYDIGLDIGMLNDRITLTADAYLKKTTDLLLNVDLPTTTGYTRAIQNIGSIQNKGLEFTVNTVNTTGKVKWTSNFNISFNRSKVLGLGESDQQLYSYAVAQNVNNNILIRTGSPIGVYYGYIGDGVYNTLTEVNNSPANKAIPKSGEDLLGEMKFVDVNADGIIDDNDRVPLAYTEPKYIGGFVNNLGYKGFDMSVVMRWSYGNDMVNGNIGELNNLSPYTNNLVSNSENMWLPVAPEKNYVGFTKNGRGGLMHSEYIEDGSFLRVDRIALGYTLPQKLVSRMKVNKLRVYMNVRNVFLATRYSWYDPEVSTGGSTSISKLGPGADLGAYPRTRQFQFGLNVAL